jgi:hypothetical protein
MAKPEDALHELARLRMEAAREEAARQKAYDMHGGDARNPIESEMPRLIAQFGEWAVTPFGVECLTYPYQIQWDSLLDPVIGDDYWLQNLAKKEWVNLHDFAEAMRCGRQIHRYLQNL